MNEMDEKPALQDLHLSMKKQAKISQLITEHVEGWEALWSKHRWEGGYGGLDPM